MTPAPFRVVLDACSVYPMVLRDTLLRAAELDLYQLLWSAEILEEARRNLVKNLAMNEDQAKHLMEVMTGAFPEAMVEGYEP